MENKINKWLVITLMVSIVIMGIGYSLWTNLDSIQNAETLSAVELRDAQKEMAIHYPLGDFLLNLGFVSFSATLLALVIRKILSMIKKTN